MSTKKLTIAVLLVMAVPFALGVMVLFFLPRDLVSWINQRIDLGGALSFAETAAIIVAAVELKYGDFGKAYNKLEKSLQRNRLSLNIPVIVMTLVGVVALWLTVRITLLFTERYILSRELLSRFSPEIDCLNEPFVYEVQNIFLMVGYALTANLCFTLARTFLIVGKSTDMAKALIDVAIQAGLIGFITLIPRVSDVLFYPDGLALDRLIKSTGFVFIMIAMIVTVVVLLFLKERLDRSVPQLETPK